MTDSPSPEGSDGFGGDAGHGPIGGHVEPSSHDPAGHSTHAHGAADAYNPLAPAPEAYGAVQSSAPPGYWPQPYGPAQGYGYGYAPVQPVYMAPGFGVTPGMAIGGFVCSLIGSLGGILCGLTIPLAVVGVILSAISLPETRRRNAGFGLALSGLIIGSLGLALFTALVLILVLAA